MTEFSKTEFINQLLDQMTLKEKIGQMCQHQADEGHIGHGLAQAIQQGDVGSVINEVDPTTIQQLQTIAMTETRLGIPLLMGRDVIHGFKTIFPICLGQAATWDMELIEKANRVSAEEASQTGVNWTFSPVADLGREPRWGRIAETYGEDPWYNSQCVKAAISGYQGKQLNNADSLAACAKHFVGYGAVESGRDYATTNISDHDLFNNHLPMFKAALEAGVATVMTSFCDINGTPASANKKLNKELLKDEWQFDGLVVSDWDAIRQLKIHGFTEDDKQSCFLAFEAGTDMEMVSTTFKDHIHSLLEEERISEEQINESVLRILGLKWDLGLFEKKFKERTYQQPTPSERSFAIAKEIASKSSVLLKNEGTLPLRPTEDYKIALIGPLADDGYEQMGTWVFDGEERHSTTIKQALETSLPDNCQLEYMPAFKNSRDRDTTQFHWVKQNVKQADVAILVLGEEALLSGEAHCRTDLTLPGAQQELLAELSQTNTPLILVLMAGRPLVLEQAIQHVNSVLYVWHPGSMGGPAIVDHLLGKTAPSGKLPVSFPRSVGQIPIYYSQKKGGKPVCEHSFVHADNFPQRAPQTSLGMVSYHMDSHFTPLFPFGFGLTYGDIIYKDISILTPILHQGDTLVVSFTVENRGDFNVEEIVQLYVTDCVGSLTRPRKELKNFKRVELGPFEKKMVTMEVSSNQLGFYDNNNHYLVESGEFIVWIGGSSDAELQESFSIM